MRDNPDGGEPILLYLILRIADKNPLSCHNYVPDPLGSKILALFALLIY
jgi:hypothetical protein